MIKQFSLEKTIPNYITERVRARVKFEFVLLDDLATFMPIKRIIEMNQGRDRGTKTEGKNGQGEKSQRRENISMDIL